MLLDQRRDIGGVASGWAPGIWCRLREPSLELDLGVPHVSDPACHPRAEVASNVTQNQNGSSGHVLTSVVRAAFDHSGCARVSHREPLTDRSGQKNPSPCGSIENCVSSNMRSGAAHSPRRRDRKDTSTHALGDVVVGHTLQPERHT